MGIRRRVQEIISVWIVLSLIMAECIVTVWAEEDRSTALEVEAGEIMYGDVNQDGACNMKDIVLLQKKLNGHEVSCDEEAADVVYDGKLNMKDIVLLQRYLKRAQRGSWTGGG